MGAVTKILSSGTMKKDFAKVADKLKLVEKPADTGKIISSGKLKPGSLGYDKDKLAKAKLEFARHDKAESSTAHEVMEKSVKNKQKELAEKEAERTPKTKLPKDKNSSLKKKLQDDIKVLEAELAKPKQDRIGLASTSSIKDRIAVKKTQLGQQVESKIPFFLRKQAE